MFDIPLILNYFSLCRFVIYKLEFPSPKNICIIIITARMSAGAPRPTGRGRGRGQRTDTSSEPQVGVVNGAASWGSGNLGAPVLPASSDATEDSEQFLIDWDAINANREESERAR